MSKKNNKSILSILVIIIFILLVIGIGGKTYMSNKDSEKLANQKDAAISLRNEYKDLSEIVFSRDGGKFSGTENDFGTWYIDVKIKISNEWYEITTGKEGGSYGGISKNFPEEKITGVTTNPTNVKYSNEKEEVLK